MKMLLWNVRGINSYRMQTELRRIISSYKGDYIRLVETKIKPQNLDKILQFVCPGWSYISNLEADDSGRILVLYRSHLVVNLHEMTDQMLHCHVFNTCLVNTVSFQMFMLQIIMARGLIYGTIFKEQRHV